MLHVFCVAQCFTAGVCAAYPAHSAVVSDIGAQHRFFSFENTMNLLLSSSVFFLSFYESTQKIFILKKKFNFTTYGGEYVVIFVIFPSVILKNRAWVG